MSCTMIYGMGFPGGSEVENLPANAGDTGDVGSIPGLVRSPEDEMATLSSLHGDAKSRT